MNSSVNLQLKEDALEIIKSYRVADLQALLDYARLSRQGNKRELFQRCKILILSNLTIQLLDKIHQINITRISSSRSHHSSLSLSMSSSFHNYHNQHSVILSSINDLPLSQHVEYVHLPFFDKLRSIECMNIPVDKEIFSPIRFALTNADINFIFQGSAKVFIRIAPTITSEKQYDVLPPYLLVQCNDQIVINNNATKSAGSEAHSLVFPVDITDKIILKPEVYNTLNCLWLQLPIHMSFKNLPKSYTLKIQLMRCISFDSLFNNILKRELQVTNSNSNDSDIEIEDTSLTTTRYRVSLICPITQSFIVVPAKSYSCSHLACFDLRAFLQMNERRVKWTCPICKKSASYDTLYVDKRLQSILMNVPSSCSTVEIDLSTKVISDCQYISDNVKQDKTNTTSLHKSDDDESIHNPLIKSHRQSVTSECITLSSESESTDESEFEEEDVNDQSPSSSTPTLLPNNLLNINEKPMSIPDQSSNSAHDLETSNVDRDGYWEDQTSIIYDFISNHQEHNQNGKRNNSSIRSLLSNGNDYCSQKRIKPISCSKSQDDDIEVVILSSNDNSDNEDQLS